jgi:radical SAM-linked protein
MTAIFRLAITKGEAIRYISHLDYARAVERAIRRSKLPAAYSEGFNPHMKMAFASALSVGVTSEAEYLDIELADDAASEAAVESALATKLPPGLAIKRIKKITAQHKALMAVVNLASYRIEVPMTGAAAKVSAAIDSFNQAASVPYVKHSPKGKRSVDIKQYVDTVAGSPREGSLELTLTVRITPTGSIKPAEVLAALAADFALPVDPAAALITRTGLFIDSKDGRSTPLDI